MKTFIMVLFFSLLTTTAAFADTYVRGYTRSNGTYVQPHYRSDPDSSINNNWSTKGNVNPYTGQLGTRNPEPRTSDSYSAPSRSGSSYGNTFGNSNSLNNDTSSNGRLFGQ